MSLETKLGIICIVLGVFGLYFVFTNRKINFNEKWRLYFIFLTSLISIPLGIYLLVKNYGFIFVA